MLGIILSKSHFKSFSTLAASLNARIENRPSAFDCLKSFIVEGLHTRLSIEKPTAVQQLSIPNIVQRKNMIIRGAEGTGKSIGVLAGLLSLQKLKRLPYISKMILVSNAELAKKYYEWTSVLFDLKTTDIHFTNHVLLITSIKDIPKQTSQELLIATPQAALFHLEKGRITLDKVETVVLDSTEELFLTPIPKPNNKHKDQSHTSAKYFTFVTGLLNALKTNSKTNDVRQLIAIFEDANCNDWIIKTLLYEKHFRLTDEAAPCRIQCIEPINKKISHFKFDNIYNEQASTLCEKLVQFANQNLQTLFEEKIEPSQYLMITTPGSNTISSNEPINARLVIIFGTPNSPMEYMSILKRIVPKYSYVMTVANNTSPAERAFFCFMQYTVNLRIKDVLIS